MPTGYTAELMEKGMNFRTFVLRCARAFNYCIEQKDSPGNEVPTPRGVPTWYVAMIEESGEIIRRLEKMSADEREYFGLQCRDKAVKYLRDVLELHLAGNERLACMQEDVLAWKPPTAEHSGLRDFMLEQLRLARYDAAECERDAATALAHTPLHYYNEELQGTRRTYRYYTELKAREEERVRLANEWIAALYGSLPK